MTINGPGRPNFDRYDGDSSSAWVWILAVFAVVVFVGAMFWSPMGVMTASNNNPSNSSNAILDNLAARTFGAAIPGTSPETRPNG
jgi:hypothetical protein